VPDADGTELGWRLAGHAGHRGYATEAALTAGDLTCTGAGPNGTMTHDLCAQHTVPAVMRSISMSGVARSGYPRIPATAPSSRTWSATWPAREPVSYHY
jgi:hypothetical protein